MIRFTIPVLFIGFLYGCTTSTPPKTIILSKENSNKTCSQFINRLDSTINWRFVDAYSIDPSFLDEELNRADGIILTGGADINPGRYSSESDTVKCGSIDYYRDSIEYVLLDFIEATNTPCIGFCRGLQIMNVYHGGTLHLHLPDTLSAIHRGPQGQTAHPIQVTKHIASVDHPIGSFNKIVSNHHQGISQLGNELEVWAVAPDGLTEGIRHSDTTNYPFYVGVQWHPEGCNIGNKFDEQIGLKFIQAVISE